MFCIKFDNHRRTKLPQKFEVALAILDLLPTKERLEVYMSDYTFANVPETKHFPFVQSTILGNQAIMDEEYSEKFITFVSTLKDDNKIRIELTPPKARRNLDYLPHIEFSFEDESLSLYDYFKSNKKLKNLVRVLNKFNSFIDEAYFYDPLNSTECYSDFENRLWQKRNNKFSFAEDLLGGCDGDDALSQDTNRNLARNFVNILYREDGLSKIDELIHTRSLNAAVTSGSLILEGKDISMLIEVLQEKLKKYIESIRNRDIYENEFKKVFN